jgi:hypothetical protein
MVLGPRGRDSPLPKSIRPCAWLNNLYVDINTVPYASAHHDN